MLSLSASPAQHVALFNDERYHNLHLQDDQRVVRHDHHDSSGRLVGSFIGVAQHDELVSGHRAPFGGIDLVRDWDTPENMSQLIEGALSAFGSENIRTVRTRCKPTSWSTAEAALQQALIHHGFRVESAELNFSIDLRNTPSLDAYREGLKKESRKALGRSDALNLPFSKLQSRDAWKEAFDLLTENRAAKGRPMNLTFEYLERLMLTFPDRITMIALGSEPMVCAALIYRVGASKAVVVRWGDRSGDLPFSPMYALAARVVEISLAEGIRWIDLGIASEGGEPNPGLVQFKRSIGAHPELRLDMTYEIQS